MLTRPPMHSCPTRPRRGLARGALAALAALGAACAAPPPALPPAPAEPAITTTRALVSRMRDQWGARYFRTLTFRQKNTLYRQGGGEDASEWLEYQSVPRRLRIEFLPAGNRSGLLFRDNRSYTFQDGRQVADRAQVHPLLLLGSDVYALPVDTTMAELAALRFDTALVRADSLDGRRVWVVGAAPGDTMASHFTVDAERMVLLRVVQRQPAGQGRTALSDTRFTEYQEIEGILVPKVIVFMRDGRATWREEYTDVRVNAPLDASLFDPARWTSTGSFAAPGAAAP